MDGKTINRKFARYVLPSLSTMVLTALYTLNNGFFIGQAIGDVGLAAINIAWPITALQLALGAGLGIGGGVWISTKHGEGDQTAVHTLLCHTLLLLLLVSLLTTGVLWLFCPLLLRLLGASGDILPLALSYARIIVLGGVLQIFACGLIPLLRNFSKTVLSMLIMGLSLFLNIGLDAFFIMVLGMGIRGAAFSTLLAHLFTMLFAALFLLRTVKPVRWPRLQPKLLLQIFQTGISPFGLSFVPSLILISNNWRCLQFGGEAAVAAYAVASYVVEAVGLILSSIGEGIQPLLSYYMGAKRGKTLQYLVKRASVLAIFVSVCLSVAVYFCMPVVGAIFNVSPQASALLQSALFWSLVAFPLMGIAKLSASYFYALNAYKNALFLIYADPLFLTPLLLLVLPVLFGIQGIWMALPAAQGLVALAGGILYYLHKPSLQKELLQNVPSY